MKIYFRNARQAVLFEHELKGQISDGHWENARPNDHWQQWCEAEVSVKPDDPHVALLGSGQPKRKNYNFSDSDLLEVIGGRMIGLVRVAYVLGMKNVETFKPMVGCDGSLTWPDYPGDYWDTMRKDAEDALSLRDMTFEALQAAVANEALYSEKDLRSDLVDMKNIIKDRRS